MKTMKIVGFSLALLAHGINANIGGTYAFPNNNTTITQVRSYDPNTNAFTTLWSWAKPIPNPFTVYNGETQKSVMVNTNFSLNFNAASLPTTPYLVITCMVGLPFSFTVPAPYGIPQVIGTATASKVKSGTVRARGTAASGYVTGLESPSANYIEIWLTFDPGTTWAGNDMIVIDANFNLGGG